MADDLDYARRERGRGVVCAGGDGMVRVRYTVFEGLDTGRLLVEWGGWCMKW